MLAWILSKYVHIITKNALMDVITKIEFEQQLLIELKTCHLVHHICHYVSAVFISCICNHFIIHIPNLKENDTICIFYGLKI